MAYLKSQYREFERIGSDSFQILVAEQALTVNDLLGLCSFGPGVFSPRNTSPFASIEMIF